MLNLDNTFRTMLQSEVVTLCRCWLITRSDAIAFGFTDFDIPLTINGIIYEAVDGFSPTNTSSTNTLSTDNTRLSGVLTSDRITELDLSAGVYDNARVDIFDVDYFNLPVSLATNPLKYIPILIGGRLGRVEKSELDFSVEGASRGFFLEQGVGDLTSKTCRYNLGDSDCTVNIAPFTFTGTVTQILDRIFFFASGVTQPFDYFTNGVLEFTSGNNVGFRTEIAFYTIGQFRLFEAPPYAMVLGDAFTAIAGCNKEAEICFSKFDNIINYGGEPHVPGNNFYANGGQGQ